MPAWVVPLVVVGCVLLAGWIYLMATGFKACPPEALLLVIRRGPPRRIVRRTERGRVFVWPFIEEVAILSLAAMPVPLTLQNSISRDELSISIAATFTVAVGGADWLRDHAVEHLLPLTMFQREALARQLIAGVLHARAANWPAADLQRDRSNFLAQARYLVERELNKVGLMVLSVN